MYVKIRSLSVWEIVSIFGLVLVLSLGLYVVVFVCMVLIVVVSW